MVYADTSRTLGKLSCDELCHFSQTLQEHSYYKNRPSGDNNDVIGIFLLYGSWNFRENGADVRNKIIGRIANKVFQSDQEVVTGYTQVDETEDSLSTCLGDNDSSHRLGSSDHPPPLELPALLVVAQHDSMTHSVSEFVTGIPPRTIMTLAEDDDDHHDGKTGKRRNSSGDDWLPHVRRAIQSVTDQITQTIHDQKVDEDDDDEVAIRIFVSGDKSSVGKSSVCLGILGSLVQMGYNPSSLAYIKPATQCEAPQLIQAYCESVGIPCVPVGPVVYYKGFTRAFLAGETESSSELLFKAGTAVDELARGKRLVMIDGVGFPSVGSICGTDNASVAIACGYPTGFVNGNSTMTTDRSPVPVLIVGGSGVGAAVDAFNLNATYFKARNVPVLGAVFNKLSLEGFYSLENCREQVTKYFDNHQVASREDHGARPFGFVPLAPGIAGESAMDHVHDYIDTFREYVDVQGIVGAAARQLPSVSKRNKKSTSHRLGPPVRPAKRSKLLVRNGSTSSRKQVLSREAIEAMAKQAGAAPSA